MFNLRYLKLNLSNNSMEENENNFKFLGIGLKRLNNIRYLSLEL